MHQWITTSFYSIQFNSIFCNFDHCLTKSYLFNQLDILRHYNRAYIGQLYIYCPNGFCRLSHSDPHKRIYTHAHNLQYSHHLLHRIIVKFCYGQNQILCPLDMVYFHRCYNPKTISSTIDLVSQYPICGLMTFADALMVIGLICYEFSSILCYFLMLFVLFDLMREN